MDELIKQLRNIPFLELDIDIELPKLIEEYQAISNKYEFKDYRTNFWQVRRKYRKAWSGISLISSDGSLYKDMYEDGTEQYNFQKTELKSTIPYMYEICANISGNQLDSRARIMRIAPKKSLVWHSHVLEHGQEEWELTIQIPIVMPERFEYCVVSADEFRWWKRFHRPNWFNKIIPDSIAFKPTVPKFKEFILYSNFFKTPFLIFLYFVFLGCVNI